MEKERGVRRGGGREGGRRKGGGGKGNRGEGEEFLPQFMYVRPHPYVPWRDSANRAGEERKNDKSTGRVASNDRGTSEMITNKN